MNLVIYVCASVQTSVHTSMSALVFTDARVLSKTCLIDQGTQLPCTVADSHWSLATPLLSFSSSISPTPIYPLPQVLQQDLISPGDLRTATVNEGSVPAGVVLSVEGKGLDILSLWVRTRPHCQQKSTLSTLRPGPLPSPPQLPHAPSRLPQASALSASGRGPQRCQG